MDALILLQKYLGQETDLFHIVYNHSRAVADKALTLAGMHPELSMDLSFIEEASLLHDIGSFKTDAPDILCFGRLPYICHGYLGSDILMEEGYPLHALVCERHTGTGLSLQEIVREQMPLPHRDMMPLSLEEQLICFADKFFSKTRLNEEFSVFQVRHKLEKYGSEGVERFDRWCSMFL